eukprot:289911_1
MVFFIVRHSIMGNCACACAPGTQYLPARTSEDKYTKLKVNGELDLIVYDFDQTITKIHLYFQLKGAPSLDISNERLIEIFGGQKRIRRLQKHLELLSTKVKYLAIISFGFENVIREALTKVRLLRYFNENLIIGKDSAILDRVRQNKALCLQQILNKYKLDPNNVLFVDDDKMNIMSVNELNIADTLWISQREGITEEEMRIIEERVDVDIENIKDSTNLLEDIDETQDIITDIKDKMESEIKLP